MVLFNGHHFKFQYKNIVNSFRLSRLNSIEHIFPQNKKDDWRNNDEKSCGDCPKACAERIDCFGNLALISQHFNSALSDDSENKKENIQRQLNRGTIESLKMLIYYSNINASSDMTVKYCQEHQEQMIDFLVN